MSSGILYLNHGEKFLARLLVSLYSLRHPARAAYAGPVTILDTDESHNIVNRIAADERLAPVRVKHFDMRRLRKHSCYVAKAELWRHSPYTAATLLLDADTIPAKPTISRLLDLAADPAGPGIVVTRFSDWVTTGDIIISRINKWKGMMIAGMHVAGMIKRSATVPHAAVNTGVVAWQKGAKILADWERLTSAGWSRPFTDELAMQLLLRHENYDHGGHTLVGEQFNASPIYCKRPAEDVVCWHSHGGKHCLRADGRGEQGHRLWWPIFAECWRENISGVREWAPAGDDRLAVHLAKLKAA